MSWLQSLLYNNLLMSIFDAAATLLFVLLIFKLFRISHPAIKFLLLLLPLLKPCIILLDSLVAVDHLQHMHRALQPSIRMPDPLNFFKAPIAEVGAIIYKQSTITLIFLIAIVSVLVILLRRWAQLFLFLSRFKKKEPLSENEYPHMFRLLDDLATKFRVDRPTIALSDSYMMPFSTGVFKPIIVLPEQLLEVFSEDQIKIVLAHELAHIKRKDSALSWLIVIVRDILFFNPLVWLAYNMVGEEMEKACDAMVTERTSISAKQIALVLIDIAQFYREKGILNLGKTPITDGFLYRTTTIERRIRSLTQPGRGRGISRTKSALAAFVFIFILYFQFGILLSFNGSIIFFR